MKKPTKGKIVTNETSDSLLDKTVNLKRGQFPIVGIGASAGGLEALEQFFGSMPKDNGMAFVVIQHLDPNHKGMMPESVRERCVDGRRLLRRANRFLNEMLLGVTEERGG